MQSTNLTSILEFYRLTLPTLDNHCILKVSAFECKKAAKRNSHSKMKKKVEILKLIIMLCNFYPLEEIEVF